MALSLLALPGTAQASGYCGSTLIDVPWGASWAYDDYGAIASAVNLEPLTDITVDYYVEAKLVLGNLDVSWTLGPFQADDSSTLELPLLFPDGAYASDEQMDALADLIVRIWVYRDDQIVDSVSLEPTRVAWPDGPDGSPLILSRDEATAEAPLGIFGVDGPSADADGEPTGSVPFDMVSE